MDLTLFVKEASLIWLNLLGSQFLEIPMQLFSVNAQAVPLFQV